MRSAAVDRGRSVPWDRARCIREAGELTLRKATVVGRGVLAYRPIRSMHAQRTAANIGLLP